MVCVPKQEYFEKNKDKINETRKAYYKKRKEKKNSGRTNLAE